MNSPLAPSSVIGATIAADQLSGVPSTNWSRACRTSAAAVATTAPQKNASHEQPDGFGLVAVEPEERRDHRADRQRREDHTDGQGTGCVGEHEHQTHHSGADEQEHRDDHGEQRAAASAWTLEQVRRHAEAARMPGLLDVLLTCGVHARQPIGAGHLGRPTRVPATYSERVNERPETSQLSTESHDQPVPDAYATFMREGWGERELDLPRHSVADFSARRRAALADAFPGERLVVPAGQFKVRSNDTDYRFRADTAHVHLTGNQTSDAVLVVEDGESVLYARPRSSRQSDEFFRDRRYGELWVGRRPSLKEMSDSLGLEVRHLGELDARLESSAKTRVLRGVDAFVDRAVPADGGRDHDFARVLSEMRLVKDAWELEQLQEACDITTLGFADSVREWDNVLKYGERWLEGTFFRRARTMGNDLGYDSIVAGGSHATTLHWTENTGPVRPGTLLLLDMGVEGNNLYTADVICVQPGPAPPSCVR